MPLVNTHTDIVAGGLKFDLSHPQQPYVKYACSECSGKSTHMHRLARAFAVAISVEIPYTGLFVLKSNNACIKTPSCSTVSARTIVYIYFD